MSTYVVQIGEENFSLTPQDLAALDLVETSPDTYHLLKNNRSYRIEVLSVDLSLKQVSLRVNGNAFQLSLQDPYDQLVQQMGLSVNALQKLQQVKAPMPGLILDILVEPGQTVEPGTQLLILEAMKMENVLKADGEGIVKSLTIQKGETVDKGQVLIEME